MTADADVICRQGKASGADKRVISFFGYVIRGSGPWIIEYSYPEVLRCKRVHNGHAGWALSCMRISTVVTAGEGGGARCRSVPATLDIEEIDVSYTDIVASSST